MPVIAASQISGDAQITNKQLKAALQQWLPAPRRVDRLILQSLLAVALIQQPIRAECGLYVASTFPARTTMASLLNAVCADQRQPKPFEFVNSVSNAAGFHIAQQLKLNGPNLFISAGNQVWQQLSMLAACDFAAGSIQQALLLCCHEDELGFCARAVLLAGDAPALTPQSDFASLSAAVEVNNYRLNPAD